MSELKSYYYIPDIWDSDDLDIEDAIKFKSNRDIDAVSGGYDEFNCLFCSCCSNWQNWNDQTLNFWPRMRDYSLNWRVKMVERAKKNR